VEYHKYSTRSEARAGFDEALRRATLRLRIFDRDGQYWGIERAEVAEALQRFLSADRDSILTMVFHDIEHLRAKCARLIDIQRQHAHKFRFLQTDEAIRSYSRGFVLIDNFIVLRKPNMDREAAYWDEDLNEISGASSLFGEILERSTQAELAVATGL
jgi:hypothetical protein